MQGRKEAPPLRWEGCGEYERERKCPVIIKHAWFFYLFFSFSSQTLFVPLAWVLTGRQNKPRWNGVCKQACEYRHETHKLAPTPDEYASAGTGARTPSHDRHPQPSHVKVNRTTKTGNVFLQVDRVHLSLCSWFFAPKYHSFIRESSQEGIRQQV